MRRNKEKPPRPAGTAPDGAVPEAERQLARWAREAEELLEAYPELDLQSECESDLFRHLLRGKLPMREAYEMAHAGELREAALVLDGSGLVAGWTACRSEPPPTDAVSGM